MDLKCPHCKYRGEIDQRPTKGTEIECESCGHTWVYRWPNVKPRKLISLILATVFVFSAVPVLVWGVQSETDPKDAIKNIPLQKRKEIYIQLMRADDWAYAYSFCKGPPALAKPPVPGRVYQLRQKLPMVRITKPEKHASKNFKTLPTGMIIKVIKPIDNDDYANYQVKIGRHNDSWMFTGRIVDLTRKQVKPPDKDTFGIRSAYNDKLLKKYRKKIAKHYGISMSTLKKISAEGYEKNWPKQLLPLSFKPD